MNTDKRYKPCSSCGSKDGLRITKEYEYCCICGFRKFKNYHYLREWLSEKEHLQWEHWSKTLAKELQTIQALINMGNNSEATRIILGRIARWQKNWKSYKELKEDIKDYDRKWADKILNEVPFKCPVYQCGGLMIIKERPYPKGQGEDDFPDGMVGDSQTPDLVCDNCNAVYRFNGFKKE